MAADDRMKSVNKILCALAHKDAKAGRHMRTKEALVRKLDLGAISESDLAFVFGIYRAEYEGTLLNQLSDAIQPYYDDPDYGDFVEMERKENARKHRRKKARKR